MNIIFRRAGIAILAVGKHQVLRILSVCLKPHLPSMQCIYNYEARANMNYNLFVVQKCSAVH